MSALPYHLGRVFYGIQEAEKKSRLFKRFIRAVNGIDIGEKLTKENIRVLRLGLAPKFYDVVLGRVASENIKIATLSMLMNLIFK